MFSTFLESISGYFDKRFLLSSFFPSLAFGGLSLLVYACSQGTQQVIIAWTAQPAEWRTFATLAFFAGLLLVAYFLQAFSVGLTRLYEGYWGANPILGRFGRRRRRFYQQQWDYLNGKMRELSERIRPLEREPAAGETDAQRTARIAQVDELYAELGRYEREWFLFYPPKRALVMPTRLGNMLRAAELYPYYRYNIDAVVTWPRLRGVLPETFASILQDAKASLDLLLNVTTLSCLFTLVWELYIGLSTSRGDWFLVISLGWVVVALAYQAALAAARTYSELIKASYDLHRWKLLSALHVQKPKSYADERAVWGDVTDLLYRNYPPNEPAFAYITTNEELVQRLRACLESLLGEEPDG